MPRPKLKKTGPSIEDETPLWEFIYENMCKRQNYEEVGPRLFENYLDDNELPWTAKQLADFYAGTMEPELYKSDLDIEKILALYKHLEIQIEPHVEKMLEIRSGAGLRIDSDRYLIHYQFYTTNNKRPAPEVSKEATKEEVDEDRVELEEPSRKKVKPWPSPVKRKSDKRVAEPTPTVKNVPAKKVTEVTPKTSKPVPLASSTPLNPASRMPLDLEISEEFNQSIWNHVRDNIDTITSEKIISEEFWGGMFETRETGIKSASIVLKHFHGNLLKKLWRQKLDRSTKMRLIKELLLPMNRAQQRWLSENEGIDVELTTDGYVKSWTLQEQDAEEEPTALPPPPRHINTWVPRHRPELPTNDFDNGFVGALKESSQSRQTSTSRTQSVASHAPSMNGFVPKRDDDMTMEKRKDKRVPFTYDDDRLAWIFIHDQMFDPKTQTLRTDVLPKGRSFWDTFIRKYQSPKTSINWCSHYRKKMVGNLYTMPFTRGQMLPLYTRLEIPITPEIQSTLEQKFACRIKVGSNGLILSWRFRDDNIREPTEELSNNEEETDGESIHANMNANDTDDPSLIADEITKLSTASTTSLASTPQMLQPSTSAQSNPASTQRKRKKSVDEDHRIKRRSQKLFEVDDEVETAVPVAAVTTAIVAEVPKAENKNTKQVSDEVVKLVDPGVEEEKEPEEPEEPEEPFIEPLDLTEYDSNFMNTYELLAVIKTVMSAGQNDEGYGLINESIAQAFKKRPSDKKPNVESIARHGIATSIDKTRGHLRRVLSSQKQELVLKTVDYCENQQVFRKRLSATTHQLDRCLEKLNPPSPPSPIED